MENLEIKFYKTRDVKEPERGTVQAAGIDFFVPVFNEQFVMDLIAKNPMYEELLIKNVILETKRVLIKPGMRLVIPSGIHTYFTPKNSALIAANKSGVATKKGLRFTCQVVDSDYTGEIHIGVANDSNRIVPVEEGEKLMQFIHSPLYLSSLVEVDEQTFNDLHNETTRGDNWQGSTDKKTKN